MSKTRLDLALLYASFGWHVFPITPERKEPPLVNFSTQASKDQAQIFDWWAEWSDANIGLHCGLSDITVVDLDVKRGKNGVLSWRELELENDIAPPTPVSQTPSAGLHYLFRGISRNTVEKIGPGIDTRSGTGYILLPGSTVDGKPYKWLTTGKLAPLPEWLAHLIGEEVVRTDDTPEADEDKSHNIERARDYLSRCPPAVAFEGGQTRTFETACKLRDWAISETLAFELMSEIFNPRCKPPWVLEQLEKIVENAYKYAKGTRPGGATAEAEFAKAPEEEWVPDPPKTKPGGAGERARAADDSGGAATNEQPGQYVGLWSKWVYCAQLHCFIRLEDRKLLAPRGFDTLYQHAVGGNQTPTRAVASAKSFVRKVLRTTFEPGRAEFLNGGEELNLWTPSTVKPAAGDISVYTAHLERLLPNVTERGHLESWLAWVLRNPTLKPNFAPIIQGEPGCGKSWLGALLRMLVGERNTMPLDTDALSSRFNSWVLHTRLGLIEELMGDDKRGLANRLKTLITQKTVKVEPKGTNSFDADNHSAFLAFTNYSDALMLDDKDRRYLVFKSPAPGEGTPDDYWEALWGFLDGPGPAAVLAHLLAYPVETGWGLGRAPRTAAHEEMRRDGLGEVQRWLTESLEDETEPFTTDIVARAQVQAIVDGLFPGIRNRTKIVTHFLQANATYLGQHRLGGRGSMRHRFYAIQDAAKYRAMSSAELVKAYSEMTGEKF